MSTSTDAGGKVAWRFAWLIERQIEGRAAWRSMTSFKPEAGWTHDANEAMQFARKNDAEEFMVADDGDGEIYMAQAIEHGFTVDDSSAPSLLAERDALKASNAALVEALEPFANMDVPYSMSNHDTLISINGKFIYARHFRDARAALASVKS